MADERKIISPVSAFHGYAGHAYPSALLYCFINWCHSGLDQITSSSSMSGRLTTPMTRLALIARLFKASKTLHCEPWCWSVVVWRRLLWSAGSLNECGCVRDSWTLQSRSRWIWDTGPDLDRILSDDEKSFRHLGFTIDRSGLCSCASRLELILVPQSMGNLEQNGVTRVV